MNAAPLLPPSPVLRLDAITQQAGVILLKATASAVGAPCPQCGYSSQSIHSRYQRTLLDLPWQGHSVRIQLRCRKFFCKNPECSRHIFVEPLPAIAARYAHKTQRLADALRELVLLVGGEVGAHIAHAFGLLVSPDALLEPLHKPPFLTRSVSSLPVPRVLGIDDFAFRKGRRYGTILIDQECRCPVDLLPDRDARSVEAWLKAHPGVQIVTRDRADFYRNGITAGAPEALQIADRFHLLLNLTQVLQSSLSPHRKHFRRTVANVLAPDQPLTCTGSTTTLRKLQARRREKRLQIWQAVQALNEQGYTQSQIAFETGVSVRTVSRFLRSNVYPERKSRARSPNDLTPFLPYLEQYWQSGKRNIAHLYRHIQQQGFCGSYGAVYGAVCRLQKGMTLTTPGNDVSCAPARATHYSPRQMTWLVLQRVKSGKLSPEEHSDLAAAMEAVPSLSELVELIEDFIGLVHRRDVLALEHWLTKAKASTFGAVQGFARGLCYDLAAVRASLEHEWSNGAVEGQVNRLKLVKRSMYGQGSFTLLKARVLHRPTA